MFVLNTHRSNSYAVDYLQKESVELTFVYLKRGSGMPN